MLELEVSFDEALLDDELFTLELFLLLLEILLELEISFDEALLDDKLLTFELLIALDELMLELLIIKQGFIKRNFKLKQDFIRQQ